MNYIKYSLIFTLSLLLISCESDDSTPEPLSQNDIQGEWYLTQLNANEPVDLNNDNEENIDLTQETSCFNGMLVNFENDTYQFTYPKINFTGQNNEILNCEDTLNTGTYTLENNILTATTTIDGSSNTENVTVGLNNNQLKFTVTNSQVSAYLNLDNSTNENADLEFLEFVFEK
jgi:hypothetical protein